MRKLLIVIPSIILLVIVLSVVSCDTPTDLNPPGDAFAGYVYFIDTNFTYSNGFYAIAVYKEGDNPFTSKPLKIDSLSDIELVGSRYQSAYKIHDMPTGKYFIASTWIKYPVEENCNPIVLGTYGCDTSYTCTSHRKLVFPNFTGNFINIYSWADTSKRLY
jgi:hypothetical protein